MIRKGQLNRLCSLLAAAVVTLALISVAHKRPISASDETVGLTVTDPAATDWVWATQASSGGGYLWSEGSPRFELTAFERSAAGYAWSSDLLRY